MAKGGNATLTQIIAVVEAVSGMTQHDERQRLGDNPTTAFDGYFQVEVGDHSQVDIYGSARIDYILQVFVRVGHELDFTAETKEKTIMDRREAIVKDLLDDGNWAQTTTGIKLINYVGTSREPVPDSEDHVIDAMEFNVEYEQAWS